jgi:hypothetical protein
MGFDPEKIRGTNVVAVVDVHQAVLFLADTLPRQQPERRHPFAEPSA